MNEYLNENDKQITKEQSKAIKKMIKDKVPLGRFGKSEEIANLVTFLLSSKSSFITGCSIPIDGGAHLQSHESIAKNS